MSGARRRARWLAIAALGLASSAPPPAAADTVVDSLAVPRHVFGALWIEQRYRCTKNVLNLEAVAPRVLCDPEVVDARVLAPSATCRIALPVALEVHADPPKRWLWWWTERGFEVVAYGAGWSAAFIARGDKLWELNGSPIEGAPRFVPHPHLALDTMPLADRKVSGIREVAGMVDNSLFSMPASRREGMRRFVGDLYYLLAERLGDRTISAESRVYLEGRRARLDDLVRFWSWLDPSAAAATDERALARAILDPKPWVRWRAAVDVGGLGSHGLDAALAALAAPERESRLAGCLALRAIGPSGVPARERLAALARSDDRELRCRATEALAAIDPRAESLDVLPEDCWSPGGPSRPAGAAPAAAR